MESKIVKYKKGWIDIFNGIDLMVIIYWYDSVFEW
jgi:hypothetical protein